jgi:xanthine dehydrogenase accessory factor
VPLGRRIRGLTRSGVPVTTGTKVIEIDPRGNDAVITGIGDRPAKIAEGVLRALTEAAPKY